MAAIRRKSDNIVFTSGNKLAVLDFRTRHLQFLEIPSTNERITSADDEDRIDKEESLPSAADNQVLASAFSQSGLYLAVCDDRKQLHVFVSNPEWTLASTRGLVRRCVCVAFSRDDSVIVVGDKCGDVYCFTLSDQSTLPQLCLGHLSILLDLVLVHSDKYIVTCDRDEKIRISHFPNSYNIHSFCLGHTEFVSSLVYVEEEDLLISGSGDCTVRVWSLDGKEKCCVKTVVSSETKSSPKPQSTERDENLVQQPAIQKLVYNKTHQVLAVSVNRLAHIKIYQLNVLEDQISLTLLQTLSFTVDPWDLIFDDLDLLWVLLPVEGSTLQVYDLKEDKTKQSLSLNEVTDNRNVEACKDIVNKNWQFFKVSLEKPNSLPSLWKQKIDNVTDYLMKKEQRLKGETNGDNIVKNEIPEKKVKAL